MTNTVQRVKRAIQVGVSKLGYRIVSLPKPGSEYSAAVPMATYAPWNVDAEFQAVYKVIPGNTLVDIYRCWELWKLVEQTAHRDGAIIEVGVWRGGTGGLLARRSALCGRRDPVYLCDTFEGVVKAGARDTRYHGGEHADTSVIEVERVLAAVEVANVRILKGIFPDHTAHLIPANERFRFCHIDVDVYQSANDVMAWVWPRLVPGGIVVFDDYGFRACRGVTDLVNEMSQQDRLVLHNLNGHAVAVKIGE